MLTVATCTFQACGADFHTLLLDDLPALHDAVVLAVAETSHGALQKLSLRNCRRIDNRALSALARCTGLRSLTLTNNAVATGAGLRCVLGIVVPLCFFCTACT